MHILIVGSPNVGKSTLLRRLLSEAGRPLFGYISRKEPGLATEELGEPIHIYPADGDFCPKEENRVGWCLNQKATVRIEGFEAFAPRLLAPSPENSLILLDEIGFMESRAPAFREAILRLLDGDRLVLAAVKDKDTPFLERVRSHPRCRCFRLTPENREAVYREARECLLAQLKD